jgi:hypothetical protein
MINHTWIKPKHLVSATLVLVVIAASAPFRVEAKDFATPEFLRGETRPKSVVLLPPRAAMIQRKMLRTEQKIEESEELEKWAAQYLAELLREKGYATKALTIGQINADPQLQELVLHANKRYDEERQQLAKKAKKVRQRRYTVGADASLLASQLEVDGVVFARVFAFGQSAKTSWIPGGMASVVLDVSVVNGTTGDVEAYFAQSVTTSFKKITTDPRKPMKKVVQDVSEYFPAATQVIEAKGSTLKASVSLKDKNATVKELETLLGNEDRTDKKEEK